MVLLIINPHFDFTVSHVVATMGSFYKLKTVQYSKNECITKVAIILEKD